MGAQKNRLIETVLLSTHNMFWMRNKENNFPIRTLIWRLAENPSFPGVERVLVNLFFMTDHL